MSAAKGLALTVVHYSKTIPAGTGIAVRQGLRFLRTELPGILATRSDVLSTRMLRLIEELARDWRRLDAPIGDLSGEIETRARQDEGCGRLITVSGVGPIISSAMVAAIECARHCARQQARPYCVGGSQQGARLRVRQHRCNGVPSSVILAPCAAPIIVPWKCK
jgi:transposase